MTIVEDSWSHSLLDLTTGVHGTRTVQRAGCGPPETVG